MGYVLGRSFKICLPCLITQVFVAKNKVNGNCYGAARRRAREGWPRAFLPTAGQEGRDFLLNSCLIRLIHLLSLYREVYLTPKQGLLDP